MAKQKFLMKTLRITSCLVALIFTITLSLAAESHAAEERYSLRDLPAFRAFFLTRDVVTAKEVQERFGIPPRYGQLLIRDKPSDVTPEHSRWIYPLGEQKDIVVMVDQGKVSGVFYYSREANGETAAETLRKP